MLKTYKYFQKYLFHYGHYALFIALIFWAYHLSNSPQMVKSVVVIDKMIHGKLSISKSKYHNYPYRDWSKVMFEAPFILYQGLIINQERHSAWYKLELDSVPENLTLDFLFYETVIGFDSKGNTLATRAIESGSSTANHKRHLLFEIPQSLSHTTIFFKVFARKWQESDLIELRFQDSSIIRMDVNQEFYNNQNFVFFIFFIFGMSAFQLIYIGSLAWSRRKKEYFYYWGFTFFGILFVLVARRIELGAIGEWKYWITSSILVYMAIVQFFYFRFIRYYLDTENLSPFVDRQCRNAEWFALAGVISNLIIYLLTSDLEYCYSFFKPFTSILIIINVYIIFIVYRLKSTLIRYLMLGAAAIAVVTSFRLIYDILITSGWVSDWVDLDTYGTLTGGIIDNICLNLGLNYKHRLEILEKQRRLDTIRNEIASELHDDLGGGLATIQLLSERSQSSINDPEQKRQIQKITTYSNTLIQNMYSIIWAMDTRNDTLKALIQFMRNYADEFLEDTHQIELKFPLPDFTPSLFQAVIEGKIRRIIFLTFKEVLTNIIKHSAASEVKIHIEFKNNILQISISDNGSGFDLPANISIPASNDSLRNIGGNGIKNMSDRMVAIDGDFNIFSEKGKGTTVVLTMPTNKS